MVHTPAHTEGGMSVVVDTPSGTAVITGFCCLLENFYPPPQITAMEMEVIPPGTHVNVNRAYDIMLEVKAMKALGGVEQTRIQIVYCGNIFLRRQTSLSIHKFN